MKAPLPPGTLILAFEWDVVAPGRWVLTPYVADKIPHADQQEMFETWMLEILSKPLPTQQMLAVAPVLMLDGILGRRAVT